jgi:hypothetical protein
VDGLASILTARRNDRMRGEIKYQLAALRFERALIRQVLIRRKAGFNANQLRVPAGTREGGQWTGDGDAGAASELLGGRASRARIAEAENAIGSQVMSDATPDPIVPGAQYAQTPVNMDTSALTGISTIDDATKKLADTLARVKDTVEFTSALSPTQYGTTIHTVFAAAVKAQGVTGIAPSDVETTFGGGYYGAKGSVRTDVVLRNDVGDVIAIYDVKTGEKGIEPARAAYLRLKVGVGNEVPIIQMSFKDGLTRKYASDTSFVQVSLNYAA